jgi:hypothetical protein
MSSSSAKVALATLLLSVSAALVACGGKSAGDRAPGGGPSKPVEARGCTYAGQNYADGDGFPATDGCNSCSCEDGSVGCTEIGCSSGGGADPGQPPISCEQVGVFYDQLLQEAKGCDPHESNPCSFRVSTGLVCGCDTFVNPKNWNRDLAAAYATHHDALSCGVGVVCGMCPVVPLRGRCTIQHGCEDTNEPAPGPGCKVGEVVYADGSSGIPDPTSCNQCVCNAGKLACTDENCPLPCPAGTKLATSCAQCGPTDACEVVELACYPVCTDVCTDGVCIGGACITGVCG